MNRKASIPNQVRWPEVRKLLIRKLHQKQREQSEQFIAEIHSAYSAVNETICLGLQTEKSASRLSNELLKTYRIIVGIATAATNAWPETAWTTIISVLKAAHLQVIEPRELERIIDKFVWAPGQEPFALATIDSKRFRELVNRETRRFGKNQRFFESRFDSKLTHEAALAQVAVLNLARRKRESIGIAIDEYFVSSGNKDSPVITLPTDDLNSTGDPFTVFREMENLAWREIKINVDPDRNGLRISARKKEIRLRIAAFPGLGRKDGNEFNAQGRLFLNIAKDNDCLVGAKSHAATPRLAVLFKQAFDIKTPPFRGGRPQFRLSIPKDSRAKRLGQKRTEYFDDNKMAHNHESGSVWLENEDPQYDPNDPLYSEEESP